MKVIAEKRLHANAPGAYPIDCISLHGLVINTGAPAATVTISDTEGTIAVVDASEPSLVRTYNLRLRGTMTITVAGSPDITVTYV